MILQTRGKIRQRLKPNRMGDQIGEPMSESPVDGRVTEKLSLTLVNGKANFIQGVYYTGVLY